jgi:hypothetical protein
MATKWCSIYMLSKDISIKKLPVWGLMKEPLNRNCHMLEKMLQGQINKLKITVMEQIRKTVQRIKFSRKPSEMAWSKLDAMLAAADSGNSEQAKQNQN